MNSSHFQIFFSQFEDFWKTETAKKKKAIFFCIRAAESAQINFSIHSPSESGCDDRWGNAGATALSLSLSFAADYLRLQLCFVSCEHRGATPTLLLWLGVKICTWRFSKTLSFNQSCALLTRDFHCRGGHCDLRGSFCVEENQLWFQPSQQSFKKDGVQHRGTSVGDTMGGGAVYIICQMYGRD